MVSVAGVDGCRAGWIVVTEEPRAFVRPDFAAVLDSLDAETVIGVDIPIGLHDEYREGGRRVDQAARKLLKKKWTSVFSAPPRCAFGTRTLPEVQAQGVRMTLQALHITSKVEQVDHLMTPTLQQRVFEVHPELCFCAMNGDEPVLSKKDRPPGRQKRRALLVAEGIEVPPRPRPYRDIAEDDLLDACAALWTARRAVADTASSVLEGDVDSRGLRMEMRV